MRIGLYPGTFDPITLGHLDIIGSADYTPEPSTRLLWGIWISSAEPLCL